ncbi:hypothetical protein TorRG33x02_037830, partial [Trema orientale]
RCHHQYREALPQILLLHSPLHPLCLGTK